MDSENLSLDSFIRGATRTAIENSCCFVANILLVSLARAVPRVPYVAVFQETRFPRAPFKRRVTTARAFLSLHLILSL